MTGPAQTDRWILDTVSFLDQHLPIVGCRCIVHSVSGKFSATFHSWNQHAANKAAALNASGRGDVYFGCAAFTDKELGRKGHNVLAVGSFWLDIDTREWKSGAPYTDRQEAKVALARFCCEVGLPRPTLVDSGYGLHVYWPMVEDLTADHWRETANILKLAASKWGLKVDTSRTTDIASILRVPGTYNRKDPQNVRPVRLLAMGKPSNHKAFRASLIAFAGADAASAKVIPDGRILNSNLTSNLKFSPNFPPSDAFEIAESCAVIRHIRDTGGNVSEPLWYAALGVLVHTIQGDAVCHDWSRGHPRYDQTETQAKIDRLKAYGPTTCARLCALSEGLCRDCSYRVDV